MATVKGVWQFDSTPAFPNIATVNVEVYLTHFYGTFGPFKSVTVDRNGIDFSEEENDQGNGRAVPASIFELGVVLVDFGETDQTVSTEFYNWLTAYATQQEETTTEITYNGTTTSIETGQAATMPCDGLKMESDVVVVFGSTGTITYNGTETAVGAGQTATMTCAGKKMLSNVVVETW